jgi:SAM-dependent methyltransferase
MTLNDYYDEYWNRDSPAPLADPLAERRLRSLRDHITDEVTRVLEVGSGSGDLVAELQQEGFDALGMDISPRAVEIASERHPSSRFITHSVEKLPWPVESSSVDLVVAFEVIAHLLRPRALVEAAWDVLRPGGFFALTTPYHGLLKNLTIALGAFDHHFAAEGDHIRFFTDSALRRLLESNGFKVEKVKHFGRFSPLWSGVFVWTRKS